MATPAVFTLGQLAQALDATLDGDPGRVVTGVAPLEHAGPDEISFLTDPRFRQSARASRAGAFLAPLDATDLPAPILRCRTPQRALIDLLRLFHPAERPAAGVHPLAVVEPGAWLDPTVAVGALCVIEAGARLGAGVHLHPLVFVGRDAEIGDETVLHPHVTVREGVRIGRRVIVHAGAVLGADGFGYVFDGAIHRKIPQVGSVLIEDDVEIGAGTTIDRATLGQTVVRRGTKIDNLVQIGHNAEIGADSIIVAQVGISGSVRLGRGVVLAGQVGVADHRTIGDGAVVGARAGVHVDIPAGETWLGTPVRPITQAKRIMAAEGQLPDLVHRLRALERRLAAVEGRAQSAAGEAP
jgi:UDP-3-O-[3-hydroxymyristoyl] glucosamine N-acyltransferase